MQIEGSGISCGVHRLNLPNNETPSREEFSKMVKKHKGCAMIVAGIPTRRREIISMLLENNFEPVKSNRTEKIIDDSVKADYTDLAFMLRHHGNEMVAVDDAVKIVQFAEKTVDASLVDMALLVMNHGNELTGSLSFFVRYVN